MATDIRLMEALPEITEAVVATYVECNRTSHLGHKPLPSRDAVVEIIEDFLDILYPGIWRRQNLHMGNVEYHVGDLIDGLHDKLIQQILAGPAARIRLRAGRTPGRSSIWKRLPSRSRWSCCAGCPTCGRPSRQDVQAAYRRRPGGEELPRDHLLLSRAGGGDDLSHRPRVAAAGRAADAADDDGVRPLENGHRSCIPGRGSGRASSSTTAPAW